MRNHDANTLALPGYCIDLLHRQPQHDCGTPVDLRPQTLAVLDCLARRADHTVAKDELMREVWPGVVVTAASR